MGPLLTAILIVKNEEARLARCLTPLKAAGCELVVTDTGSTDRTVEIAKSFGARIFHFPWNGNESDARNVSLREATGRWVFWVDADETVDSVLVKSLQDELSKYDADPRYQSGSVVMRNLYQGTSTSLTPLLRIARRRPDLQFVGAIHPQLNFQQEIFTLSGILEHDGYRWTPEQRRRKAEHMRRHLEPLCQGEKPPFHRYCELLSVLLIGDDREVFFQQWKRMKNYSPEERLHGPYAHYWRENSTNLFQFFARQDDFESGLPWAEELLSVTPSQLGARFYLLQRSVRDRDRKKVGEHSEQILSIASRPSEFYNTIYPEQQVLPARAWNWWAAGDFSTVSECLLTPKTLPTLLVAQRERGEVLTISEKRLQALLKVVAELQFGKMDKALIPSRLIAVERLIDETPSLVSCLALILQAVLMGMLERWIDLLKPLERLANEYSEERWLSLALERLGPKEPLLLETIEVRNLHQN